MTVSGRYPMIIQGGMGVSVSNWVLAHAVARRGCLGVVSGTGIDVVLARKLQLGDVGGNLRAAFDAFPIPEMAHRVWERYFQPEGKDPAKPFRSRPTPKLDPGKPWFELTVLANFAEVWLAKHGAAGKDPHGGLIGINLLEKIQLPHLPSLFGAMLAGVDVVLMGAGIPRQIPAALDSLSVLNDTDYKIDVQGARSGESYALRFSPRDLADWPMEQLKRPMFLAIISSTVLAQTLLKKCTPPVDGFVVEGPLAGGHNAPPRGEMRLDENREPIYGDKDVPDLAVIRDLGAPFWLAGDYGRPSRLAEALEIGASGVQVGTAFAFCRESGLEPHLKAEVLRKAQAGEMGVYTDPLASPTGFPFKVLQLDGTLSEESVYQRRGRICDLGYLRTAYRQEDGNIGYRCASEPEDDYVRKGGDYADTVGRKCICNGLLTTMGLGQVRKDGSSEPPILTAGNDVANVHQFLAPGADSYSAGDVIDRLLEGVATPPLEPVAAAKLV